MKHYKHYIKYCTNYEQIENYELAKADNFKGWECHHKLEIHEDYTNTVNDLKLMNLYYNRPPEELIFLTTEEHHRLHDNYPPSWLGRKRSEETKHKMLGNQNAKGHKRTEAMIKKYSEANKGLHKGQTWKLINGKRVWLDR